MNTAVLSGDLYARMVQFGAAYLLKYKDIVNDLNVFPVPDGDTGDNMYMTISSGYRAAGNVNSPLPEVSDRIARGMLLGARGNSGVILSRIFSGIAKGLQGSGENADVHTLGGAFRSSIHEAYTAVSNPVEGTILSVYRDAVTYAADRLGDGSTLESFFEDLSRELQESLDRTPELLPVLKEAGVVDSGGAGFVYIAEGMKKALSKEAREELPNEAYAPAAAEAPEYSSFTEDSELEYGYCTEFLLQLQNSKVDAEHFDASVIRDYLERAGNSVVSFKDGTIVKVHVHTRTPGEILNFCQQFGEFLTLKIENMTIQHHETEIRNEYHGVADEGQEEDAPKIQVNFHKKYGFVTVASGEGIRELFLELGADAVIEGGQSMNPSAESFLKAFEEINADTVFILPNNSNIILTAKQAAALAPERDIRIIETRTVGDGYAVLSMLDTTLDTPEEILSEAAEALRDAMTGMVAEATRDTEIDGVKVRKGDYLGFTNEQVLLDTENRSRAALELAGALGAEDHDILLLIRGCSVSEEEAEALKTALSGQYRDLEIILIAGLQPIYDYILVLE